MVESSQCQGLGKRLSRVTSGARNAQIRVLADQRRHLPQAEFAAGQRLLVEPLEADQVVDREADQAVPDRQPEPVRALCVRDRRQWIGTLGDEVETVALAQVAGVERTLVRPAPPEVRDVVRVEIAVVVLLVRAGPRRELEQILAVAAGRVEEQNAQPWLANRPEISLDNDVRREILRAPEDDVRVLAV